MELFAETEPAVGFEPSFAKSIVGMGENNYDQHARDAFETSDKFFPTSSGLSRFRTWLYAGFLDGTTADDSQTWNIRENSVMLAPGDDGGFAVSSELIRRWLRPTLHRRRLAE